jgi:uncharacterized protein YlxP (DUF503 family)
VHILAGRAELRLPAALTLKDKRRVRQAVLERLWAMRLAAAELEHQEDPKRLVIGLAAVGSSPALLRSVFEKVERYLGDVPEADIVDFSLEFR